MNDDRGTESELGQSRGRLTELMTNELNSSKWSGFHFP